MLLSDLADYLSSEGHGISGNGPGQTIFEGKTPGAVTGTLITIYETGGTFPIRTMASGPGQARLERPRVQVVVRDPNYAIARAKANNVFRSLDGLPQRVINGTTYFQIAAVQSPFQLPPDANQRNRIACNYDVWKALSTSSST